jgi:hypothetical protein
VWHIKKLIKQHDHYTGAPFAGDNKKATQHNATDAKLKERAIGMPTTGISTRVVAREC